MKREYTVINFLVSPFPYRTGTYVLPSSLCIFHSVIGFLYGVPSEFYPYFLYGFTRKLLDIRFLQSKPSVL